MPYADNQGVRIHYRVEGEGPPLVLQHGFTGSIEDWYEAGYVDALRPAFRVILVDARGHGASDKPHDPNAYLLETRAADVAAVLDSLGIARAHFWGYSMGGWIGFGMAKYAADRVDALVIGGQHPYARSGEANREFVQKAIAGGCDAFVVAVEQRFGFKASSAFAARLRSADLEAYLALSVDRPSLDNMLPNLRMRCCLYSGEADPTCAETEAASRPIPDARFFSLPNLTHLQAFERSDLVLPRVVTFLRGGGA